MFETYNQTMVWSEPNKVFIPSTTARAIAHAMTKSELKAWKSGIQIKVSIKYKKPLKRWGDRCELTLVRTKILKNNLIEDAWGRTEVERSISAAYATQYFIHGDERDYKISISF